ncbi:hypothetical protein MYAM1_002359 [Malassezia yamatoensis]|uniref:SAGA-associated factor 11 n=1 Tax=Malassezia yamatoensis TaxID=253288 RepID=A0AAJ6CH78_9BASI|nr:hypothetical protein MYAM1_002359 [Malassezia yamatoensis]
MDAKALFASRLFSSLLNEIVVDTALETHQKVKLHNKECSHCGGNCSKQVASDSLNQANGPKQDYYSNNPLFECLVCSRQVSSNRYATHLEKCMGMGMKLSRKSSSRNAKTASSAMNARLLNTDSVPNSPSSSATSLPRKRGASPDSQRTNAQEKVSKRERTSTPASSIAQESPTLAHSTLPANRTATPSKAATHSREDSKARSKLHQNTTANGAPSSEPGTLADRAEELEVSDDPDFPSGFSVSSNSDDSDANAGLSEGDPNEANEDGNDTMEFDLDEVDDDSDNENTMEVDIDAELEDSDDNDQEDLL